MVYKIKMKYGANEGFKGYELQVVSKSSSRPSSTEVKEALIRAGFKPGNGTPLDFDVLSKS